MQVRIHHIPTLAALCLGALLAMALTALLIIPSAERTQGKRVQDYGDALANLASRQTVDATFNHDLVRLQLILQDITDNPGVMLATIHDVENNLLVQAGETRFGRHDGTVHTSPIILHDSIAGYVSVSVNYPPATATSTSMIFLLATMGLLFIAVASWSFYRADAIEFIKEDKPQGSPGPLSSENNTSSDGSASEHEFEGHGYNNNDAADHEGTGEEDVDDVDNNGTKVYAIIHLKNLDVLKQQLNGESFRSTLACVEHIIRDVMGLYGGRQVELNGNYYVLTFKAGEEIGEAQFRAACSAYLILELAGIVNKIPLDLAALVSEQEQDLSPGRLPFSGLIINETGGQNPLMLERIALMDLGTEDGRKVFSGFYPPYQSLLENQRKQLAQRN